MFTDESGLPLIAFMNVNVIISPLDAHFNEQFLSRETINEFINVRECVGVLHCVFVDVAIVLNGTNFSILFRDEVESNCLG